MKPLRDCGLVVWALALVLLASLGQAQDLPVFTQPLSAPVEPVEPVAAPVADTCTFSEWSDWSQCSEDCGEGVEVGATSPLFPFRRLLTSI